MIELPEYDIIPPIKGLKAKLSEGSSNPKTYFDVVYGNYVEGDDKCEEMIIDQPCGEWAGYPISGFSGVYIYHLGVMAAVEELGNIRTRYTNGTYSDWNYLWPKVSSDTWLRVQNARKKCTVKVKGLYNTWKPDRHYTIEGVTGYWRAHQFKFDIMKNRTEIKLREI